MASQAFWRTSGKNCDKEPTGPNLSGRRLIPKPGKPGKFRPLGIPTLKDRLVQMALKLVLEPIFEADFYPTSYGFRPGRSTHDALARVRHRLNPTSAGPSRTRYVIEGDIKGCFDAIDHHVLMDRVRRRIQDRKVLRLVLAFLKADIMIEGNLRHPVTGTPQGGIISPLLANVYLTAIDERYGRWIPNPRDKTRERAQQRLQSDYETWSAGLLRGALRGRLCRPRAGNTARMPKRERQALAQFLKEELRMELSMEKTKITDVREGFDFLGYRVAQKKMPSTETARRHALHPEEQVAASARQDQGQGEGNANRPNPRRPHRRPQSGHHRLAQLLPICLAGMEGVRQARLVAVLAPEILARQEARQSIWKEAAPPSTPSQDAGTQADGGSGDKKLARFADAKRLRYPDRGLRIPNGWNATQDERFRKGADKFWEATLRPRIIVRATRG